MDTWDYPVTSLLLIFSLLFGCPLVQCHHSDYFTVAVYEHSRVDPLIADSSSETVRTNLWWYEKAAAVARQQGADLILYPEYGIVPPASERNEIKPYLEFVPNPEKVIVNPCEEAHRFINRPILYSLSCMAKANDIVIVANMGSLVPCKGDINCPEDGQWQFNTNVVFDKNGTLLARYYKEHLYFELSMDLPREKQNPVFKTDFGKFAMFICFDMIYEKMGLTWKLQDVDAILFSTMWFSTFPFDISTQWFQSWAMGNNATLLAANIQIPGHTLAGSGIFRGRKGSVVHNFNPDGISKLMVATLPKRNQDISSITQLTAILENGTGIVKSEGTDVPAVCSYAILGMTEDVHNKFRCNNQDVSNYTLIKLNQSKSRVGVCSSGMCCELEYVASEMNESFYLGVFNGTHNSSQRYMWAEEDCFLARCDDIKGTPCSHFPTVSNTLFHKIILKANFTTTYVYPSVMSNRMKLIPVDNWSFQSKRGMSTVEMKSMYGVHVIAATLKGRVYGRDPPFTR